ncbi:MAG: BamA/TamA family outer membrane protein [Bacteroidota bacterium]|nr:BamA/TamA family outer membrane protein [Bacteroidota bacterium]MDW8137944.1 BamA/TamA family outer membrane protein [Bacteroidota bacterium]MDW8286204.1 BamA/TamA family outer membrane protein [Bacteroidota bacterium]
MRGWWWLWIGLGFGGTGWAMAQPARPPLVREVQLEGNRTFADEELLLLLQTRPNRRLLDFLPWPRLPIWLWMYELGQNRRLPPFLRRVLLQSGEPPQLLDTARVSADRRTLERFYRRRGFRSVQVDTQFVYRIGDPSQVTVRFRIREGPRTTWSDVRIAGAPPELETLLRRPRGPLRPGKPLDELLLVEERDRILNWLHDHGYAAANLDSIRAYVTVDPRRAEARLELSIRTGPRFRIGDVSAFVEGPLPQSPARTDSLRLPADKSPDGQAHWMRAHLNGEPFLEPGGIWRQLKFQPGEWYNRSRLLATKQQLANLPLVGFADLTVARPTTREQTHLPVRLEVRTLPRHQLDVQGDFISREGIGFSSGIGYQNANLLGEGEQLGLRLSGSLESSVASGPALRRFGFFDRLQAEAQIRFELPYLAFPLQRWDAQELLSSRMALELSGVLAQQREYRIWPRWTIRYRANLQHDWVRSSQFDLLELLWSDVDTLRGFRQAFLLGLDTLAGVPVLESYRPYVNSVTRWTYRWITANLLTRRTGVYLEALAELGGIAPWILDLWAYTPGILEGSLPSVGRARRLSYSLYAKLQLDARRYYAISERATWGWKLLVGAGLPFGAQPTLPFESRFFGGGPTSVRGWEFRQLGPGRLRDKSLQATGADIKLEASLEWRTELLRNFLAANWNAAFFSDAGNVWYGPRNPGPEAGRFRFPESLGQLAWGAGLGLRLDWTFVVFRADWAVRLYDPAIGRGWLPSRPGQRGLWWTLHVGLGQAF